MALMLLVLSSSAMKPGIDVERNTRTAVVPGHVFCRSLPLPIYTFRLVPSFTEVSVRQELASDTAAIHTAHVLLRRIVVACQNRGDDALPSMEVVTTAGKIVRTVGPDQV